MGLVMGLMTLVAAVPGLAAERPVLEYQRINVLIAGVDNRQLMRVWEDGRLELRYPPYSPRAGTHVFHTGEYDAGKIETIRQAILSKRQKLEAVPERLDTLKRQDLVEIQDADIVRVHLSSGNEPLFSLRMESPEAWARLYPDEPGFEETRQIDEAFLALMQSLGDRHSGEEP